MQRRSMSVQKLPLSSPRCSVGRPLTTRTQLPPHRTRAESPRASLPHGPAHFCNTSAGAAGGGTGQRRSQVDAAADGAGQRREFRSRVCNLGRIGCVSSRGEEAPEDPAGPATVLRVRPFSWEQVEHQTEDASTDAALAHFAQIRVVVPDIAEVDASHLEAAYSDPWIKTILGLRVQDIASQVLRLKVALPELNVSQMCSRQPLLLRTRASSAVLQSSYDQLKSETPEGVDPRWVAEEFPAMLDPLVARRVFAAAIPSNAIRGLLLSNPVQLRAAVAKELATEGLQHSQFEECDPATAPAPRQRTLGLYAFRGMVKQEL